MSRRQQQKKEDEMSSDEGSFASFDDDGALSGSASDDDLENDNASKLAAKRKNALLDKDSDEEDLERFVLGSKETFREQLFRDDFLPSVTNSTALVKATVDNEGDNDDKHAHLSDSMLFTYDAGDDSDDQMEIVQAQPTPQEEPEETPAWEDSDDERLTVSLAGASRLRKLRNTETEDVVSGTEYAKRLRQQYLRLYPLPEWAQDATAGSKRRRRRSSAGSDSASGSDVELDSDGEEIDNAPLPLDAFLRDANSFARGPDNTNKRRKLRPETIDIQRTRDIPDMHKAGISSLAFHPRQPILLSTSTSSVMYLHHIDPAAHPTPNPALTSVQVKRTDLRRAAFVGPAGDEVVFAGRRRYFHSWNLSSGLVKKVSKIQAHQREHRTMERFRASPCGRYLAIVTSDKKGGGSLNIVSVTTMQWVAQARIDGRGGVTDFAWWSDGEGLTIAGKDGQVTEWSMKTRRTVGVWRDDGSIGGTVMALGGSNGPAELGGDRWVAIGSNSGVLNVYDRNELLAKPKQKQQAGNNNSSTTATVEIKKLPTPTRTFEHLTTAISVVTFSPDGQLLAFGTQLKKDTLRLVHLPSCTVYRNWPTEQTPLGRITAVAFSAGSDVLAVGNDVGKIRLWEIRA
ncbi:WD40-repeat-containing domain protein [Chaetomium sp. MPI-SDFR-AT-0129]|nr:WD40-repeat-containing domain protein [Chaetomium sp. MPI-SDFR-AT-0129]